MIYSEMREYRNIPATLDTYNLDAVSPRTTNKNSSHKICGEAEERENFFHLFPFAKRRITQVPLVCCQREICEQSNTENSPSSPSVRANFDVCTDLTQRVMVRGVRLGGSRQKATSR